MKLLFAIHQFYPEFQTGTEKFLFNLSTAMQRDGHGALVASYTYLDLKHSVRNGKNLYRRNYIYRGLPVVSVRHKAFPEDLNTSLENPDIETFAAKLLKEADFDLLHIAHPMRLASFAKAALRLGIPYMFTLTDFWMICPRAFLQTSSGSLCTGPEGGRACRELCPELKPDFIKARLDQGRTILSNAAAIAAPSRFLAAIFRNEFPDLKIRIIPHGMDFKYLKRNSKSYGNKDGVVFAYCGSLSPHKGVHLLLEAFLGLDSQDSKLKLYGAGSRDENYLKYLRKIAGNDPRIEFCQPYRSHQTGDIMNGIDIMVLPSICYESYSLTLHESLACNVPVIASEAGEPGEKLTDASNGFTFKLGDAGDLRNRLQTIVDAPQIINSLKQNISEMFFPSVEEEAYLYGRLYSKILQGSARTGPQAA